jgi:SecD/SecF fusion protein
MTEKNVEWKLLTVAVVTALFLYALWPPAEKLKQGIDLRGGSKLLYQINAGEDDPENVADEMIKLLRRRVDPSNVRNLVWRAVGRNRIEIQMPAQNPENKALRTQYQSALADLLSTNIRLAEVEIAMKSASSREERLESLAQGIPTRLDALNEFAAAYDALQKAEREGEDPIEPENRYNEARKKVLDTNVPESRLKDALDIEKDEDRTSAIASMKTTFSGGGRSDQIAKLADLHAQWRKKRGQLDDPESLKRLLRGAGALDFRILPISDAGEPDRYLAYEEQLKKEGPGAEMGKFMWIPIEDPDEFVSPNTSYVVAEFGTRKYVLAHTSPNKVMLHNQERRWQLRRAAPDRDPQNLSPQVRFELNETGAFLFRKLTSNHIDEPLCIVLDGEAISAPSINSAIGQHGVITGQFTAQEVREFASKLNAGTLPARLQDTPISEQTVGPSFGETNREKGKRAALYGLIAVMVFMGGYYLYAGLIANLAVLMNLVLVLGAMATMEATFTLPGIAGLILTVGMAVDANVLIFERIREELHGDRPRSVRQAIKNGYDRAFWTIFDANVTTVLTAVILYMVGTEEVKGFAVTLGLGIVFSMITALYVTRLVFTLLLKRRILKSTVPMLKLIGRPQIDWLSLRRYFTPVSAIVIALGMAMFLPLSSGRGEIYDIEFRGGAAAQLQLVDPQGLTDQDVEAEIQASGRKMIDQAAILATATVKEIGVTGADFLVSGFDTNALPARRAAAAIEAQLGHAAEKGGVRAEGGSIKVQMTSTPSLEEMRARIAAAAEDLEKAGEEIDQGKARRVGDEGNAFEFVTTATAVALVEDAILDAWEDRMKIRPAIDFSLEGELKYFPIEESRLDKVLGLAEGEYLINSEGTPENDVPRLFRGVAFVLKDVSPPQSIDEVETRIKDMRAQPAIDMPHRTLKILGFSGSETEEDDARFKKLVVAFADEKLEYSDDPERRQNWENKLVTVERQFLDEALRNSEPLKQLTQFAAQVASQTKQQALIAMLMALAAIVAYIWVRFGSMQYGLCAILALQHDVLIALGAVAFANTIAGNPIASLLMLDAFKIDLAMVGAFLTIIGYSLNDTIVVFDRIRENRGRLAHLSSELINNSINQTLARTALTSMTTFLVLAVMFLSGGAGIHGFAYVMLVGVVVGTYSSVAVAAPALLYPKAVRYFYYAEIVVIVGWVIWSSVPAAWAQAVLAALLIAGVAFVLRLERRM